jgi:Fimbrial assembly protein (PilN)
MNQSIERSGVGLDVSPIRRHVKHMRLLLAGLILSMLACQPTSPPPSKEFEPEEVSLSAEYPKCAKLDGTYSLTPPNSPEYRLFSPYQQPAHQMDLVQITHERNNVFRFRLKMREARFLEQVSALQKANPEAYAKWLTLITRWKSERHAKQSTEVMEREILELGPLPERGGVFTPKCEGFWNLVLTQQGAPIGLEAATEINTIETDASLSRAPTCGDCTIKATHGALLFRYDNYRIRSAVFGGWARSRLLNRAYAKLNPAPEAWFDWEWDDQMLGDTQISPSRRRDEPIQIPDQRAQPISSGTEQSGQNQIVERPANLAAVLADVQQTAMAKLSANGSLSEFVIDERSPNDAIQISMKGEAGSHREVSEVLRALDQHEHIESSELVIVQATDKNTYEFEIQLKLIDWSQ